MPCNDGKRLNLLDKFTEFLRAGVKRIVHRITFCVFRRIVRNYNQISPRIFFITAGSRIKYIKILNNIVFRPLIRRIVRKFSCTARTEYCNSVSIIQSPLGIYSRIFKLL